MIGPKSTFLKILYFLKNGMDRNWVNKNQCPIGCTGCRKIFRREISAADFAWFLVVLENTFIFSQCFHQKRLLETCLSIFKM